MFNFFKKKTQPVEKPKNNFVKKGSSFGNSGTNLRTKNRSSPGRGGFLKPSFVTKSHPITNDYERIKLAEQ